MLWDVVMLSLRSWRFCWGTRASGEAASGVPSSPLSSRLRRSPARDRAPQQNRQLRRLGDASPDLFENGER